MTESGSAAATADAGAADAPIEGVATAEAAAAITGVAVADAAALAPDTEEASARSLRFSILISAVRCTLAYVILPFATPLVGLAPGVGPAVGIPVALVALWANAASIRRHWISDHRWKWPVSVLNAGIIVLLIVLLVFDVNQVL